MFSFLKDTRKLTLCAMLSALAFVLSLIEIPTPFQSYLSIDLSELPILIGACTLNTGGLIIITILRSLLRLCVKGTLIFGELAATVASILMGLAFIGFRKLIRNNPSKIKKVLLYSPIIVINVATIILFIILKPTWMVMAIITLAIPLLAVFIMNLVPRFRSEDKAGFVLEASLTILVVAFFMTIINFLIITPSNFFAKFATYQGVLDAGITMDEYILVYIIPLIPFNILKYTIVFVSFYLIRNLLKMFEKRRKKESIIKES